MLSQGIAAEDLGL